MREKRITRREGVDSGLTRADLLAVIGSLVLLVSILVPVLGSVMQSNEQTICEANLRQVGIVVQLFLQEEDFTMPNCLIQANGRASNGHLWYRWDGRRYLPSEESSYWGTAYNKYVKDINIFRCPAIAQFAEMLTRDLLPGYPSGAEVIEQASFGLNGYVDQLNTNSVFSQAEVIICTDHVEPRVEQANEAAHGDMFCIGNGSDRWNLSHFRPGSATPARQLHYRGIFRHNIRSNGDYETGGRASVLWLDGRVSTIEETTGENVPNRWYDPRGIWLH